MIGIIGGSGLYRMRGAAAFREERITTPFGEPSSPYAVGELNGRPAAFLARHGAGHTIMPSEINHRANIYGFKKLGAERIIGISASGSLSEKVKPLHAVLPDQFFDRTKNGAGATFFGGGVVAHIAFSEPVCGELLESLSAAGRRAGADIHAGGAYLNMEGPAFSTKAESSVYRSWGMDVIGMTALPEAKLAREAEICYASLAMVTDYDCWKEDEPVGVEVILSNMEKNAETAQSIITGAMDMIPAGRGCGCADSLKNAIVTDKSMISAEMKEKLGIIIGKYIG